MPHADHYPGAPGYKEHGGTSERAAALRCLQRYGGLTADEVAARLGETPFAMRPRLTELFNLGQIHKGPDQRRNVSGRWAWVWHCVPKQRDLFDAPHPR
jgi:predicted ArsR family transcriptional regulator